MASASRCCASTDRARPTLRRHADHGRGRQPARRGAGSLITDVDGVRGRALDRRRRPHRLHGGAVPRGDDGVGRGAGRRAGHPRVALLAPDRWSTGSTPWCSPGGSAFGLAAADGVMRWCEERASGFPTAGRAGADRRGPRPLRPRGGRRRGATRAAEGAAGVRGGRRPGAVAVGPVGRGTGRDGRQVARRATTPARRARTATVRARRLVVGGAAWPSTRSATSTRTAGATADLDLDGRWAAVRQHHDRRRRHQRRLDKGGCLLVAQGGHDGMARALVPAHTRRRRRPGGRRHRRRWTRRVDVVRPRRGVAVERAIRSV